MEVMAVMEVMEVTIAVGMVLRAVMEATEEMVVGMIK